MGLSDRNTADFSLEAKVKDLEAVIDGAGIDRCAIMGLSEGGPTAVAYALKHPDRVSRLVLYGSNPSFNQMALRASSRTRDSCASASATRFSSACTSPRVASTRRWANASRRSTCGASIVGLRIQSLMNAFATSSRTLHDHHQRLPPCACMTGREREK